PSSWPITGLDRPRRRQPHPNPPQPGGIERRPIINELVTVAGNEPLRPIRNGVWKRVISESPALNVDEIFFDAGIATDAHGHDVEQAAYQVAGRFEIDFKSRGATPGPGGGDA